MVYKETQPRRHALGYLIGAAAVIGSAYTWSVSSFHARRLKNRTTHAEISLPHNKSHRKKQAFCYNRGPTIQYNHFPALWYTSITIFSAIQLVNIDVKKIKSLRTFRMDGTYFMLMSLASFITFVSFAVAPRYDTFVWSFLILVASVTSLIFLHARRSIDSHRTVSPDGVYLKEERDITATPAGLKARKCARGCNGCLKILVIFIMILLVNGAVQQALVMRFPAPGTRASVALADGRKQTLHFLCVGPKSTSSQPTFWFDASNAHGVVDFYGVQARLAEAGRRACTYDQPSFGWSDYWYADQNDQLSYYDGLLAASGETGPFVFAGWGGGGSQVTRYAVANPSKTAGLVFLDVAPNGVEWTVEQRTKSLTAAQTETLKRNDLAGRISLCQIILGLAVPWGLMPIFMPYNPGNYYPIGKYEQLRAMGTSDKLWANQYWGIRMMQENTVPVFETLKLPFSVAPLVHISTKLSDSQICAKVEKYDPTADCAPKIASENALFALKYQMTTDIQSQATFVYCSEDDCDLGFPIEKSQWTAAQLVAKFP